MIDPLTGIPGPMPSPTALNVSVDPEALEGVAWNEGIG
jgi:hypothetical protein